MSGSHVLAFVLPKEVVTKYVSARKDELLNSTEELSESDLVEMVDPHINQQLAHIHLELVRDHIDPAAHSDTSYGTERVILPSYNNRKLYPFALTTFLIDPHMGDCLMGITLNGSTFVDYNVPKAPASIPELGWLDWLVLNEEVLRLTRVAQSAIAGVISEVADMDPFLGFEYH